MLCMGVLTSNGVQTAKDENDKITMYGLGGFRLISQKRRKTANDPANEKYSSKHWAIYTQWLTLGARGYSLKAGTRDALRSHIMASIAGWVACSYNKRLIFIARYTFNDKHLNA